MKQEYRERMLAALMEGTEEFPPEIRRDYEEMELDEITKLEPIIDTIIDRERAEAASDVRRLQGAGILPEVRELSPPVSPKGPELPVPQMRTSVG